jgi:hypothetical protein
MTNDAAPLFHFWEPEFPPLETNDLARFVRPDTYDRTIDEGKPA